MHARIYTLKSITEKRVKCSNGDTLLDYFEQQGRGIDYVGELEKSSFQEELQSLIQDALDTVVKGTKMEEVDGTFFLKIPTALLKTYVEECIENLKQSVMKVNLHGELEKARYGAGAVERKFELGELYENLILDNYGIPRTFYSWALSQLSMNRNEKFIKYEVVQIFDFHY